MFFSIVTRRSVIASERQAPLGQRAVAAFDFVLVELRELRRPPAPRRGSSAPRGHPPVLEEVGRHRASASERIRACASWASHRAHSRRRLWSWVASVPRRIAERGHQRQHLARRTRAAPRLDAMSGRHRPSQSRCRARPRTSAHDTTRRGRPRRSRSPGPPTASRLDASRSRSEARLDDVIPSLRGRQRRLARRQQLDVAPGASGIRPYRRRRCLGETPRCRSRPAPSQTRIGSELRLGVDDVELHVLGVDLGLDDARRPMTRRVVGFCSGHRLAAMSERELLRRTAEIAGEFLESLDDRPVWPAASVDELRAGAGRHRCRTSPSTRSTVVEELAAAADPGVVAIPSGRYFGFVIGGALPAALAADWLTAAWDQNAGSSSRRRPQRSSRRWPASGSRSCSGFRRRRVVRVRHRLPDGTRHVPRGRSARRARACRLGRRARTGWAARRRSASSSAASAT